MDQYPFELNFYVAGCQVDDFIEILKSNGFIEQAKVVKIQFDIQLKNI